MRAGLLTGRQPGRQCATDEHSPHVTQLLTLLQYPHHVHSAPCHARSSCPGAAQAAAPAPAPPARAGFPVPLFSPGFMTLKADTVSGTLSVAGHCYLWYPGPSGERVGTTGLPNWQAGPYLPGQGDNVPCEYAAQHSS